MIPISKQILNRKQKRAALVSCTLFVFMGFLVSMALVFHKEPCIVSYDLLVR